jgi:nifR3 family TIM-barrel protein
LPPPLQLGNGIVVDPPVILAPMAGVTNYPFREMCRRAGAGLCISEMLLAKEVVESGTEKGRARFGPGDAPRSAQLYGTNAAVIGAAAERLIADGVQHIDLNFGCPAPKVLRKGGGAAITADPKRLRKIVTAVMDAAAPHGVPVTAKMRLGLDWESLNYLEAGLIVQDCGVSAVILHARTAADKYAEGAARRSWMHIAALAGHLDIPVLANGDLFTATDALRTLQRTGAAGVVIGRGCLGRPWLFQDIADAYRLKWASETTIPEYAVVADTMMQHLESAVAWQAADGVEEAAAVASMRKFFGWYWRGYNGLPNLWIPRMCKETTVAGVRAVLREADPDNVSYSYKIVVGDRGKYDPPPQPESMRRKPPAMPDWPKKSGSQRLPKTEKGRRERAAREAVKQAERDAQIERVKEWRRARAQPRRRAKALTVQRELAKRGVKTGPRPVLPPKRSRSRAGTPGVRAYAGKDAGFVEAPVWEDVDVGDDGDEVVSEAAGGGVGGDYNEHAWIWENDGDEDDVLVDGG